MPVKKSARGGGRARSSRTHPGEIRNGGHSDRLSSLEGQLSRFKKRQRHIVSEEIRNGLENLGRPGLGGLALSEEMRNLRQIQEQGWSANLFEGLLLNSTHRDEVKRRPEHHGRILDDHDKVEPDKSIYLVLDADKMRLLELTAFAFAQLLANQARGVPEAKIEGADGIWAFQGGSNGVQTTPVKVEVVAIPVSTARRFDTGRSSEVGPQFGRHDARADRSGEIRERGRTTAMTKSLPTSCESAKDFTSAFTKRRRANTRRWWVTPRAISRARTTCRWNESHGLTPCSFATSLASRSSGHLITRSAGQTSRSRGPS